MVISGLQKMTLLDYPNKVACTVFLSGCNFRCPFCHNGQLLETSDAIMTEEELLSFLTKRKGLLDAVCISGGEPTLQPELGNLLRKIKEMGYCIKLDTNGSCPDVLKDLVRRGLLDYVAMDIKNCPDRYNETAGVQVQLEQIEESVRFLTQAHVDYEFRTTVVAQMHDQKAIEAMGQWVYKLAGGEKINKWFVQPFVDRDTVMYSGLYAPNEAQLSEFVGILRRFSLQSSVRG